jgi:beta-glucosidase
MTTTPGATDPLDPLSGIDPRWYGAAGPVHSVSMLSRCTAAALAAVFAAACDAAPTSELSSAAVVLPYRDPSLPIDTRVEDLLARMTLADKLGQMTQPDVKWGYVTPQMVTELRLGSVLSGGDSAPQPGTPQAWADTYDRIQAAALATPLGIPLMYATDAVHGHALANGATVFPHNIGLGSTRDPGLVERIGAIAGEEIAATGLDWTFAPVVAVTRDDHWGRVYESFGEIPELPTAMTSMVTGLQSAGIMATAKHYIGDGGTVGGDDQGDTVLDEASLRALHLPPFRAAVERGVGAVMVSYSSWNGAKLHGHRYLISDVLKGELGFGGIVITDWDGIERLDGEVAYSGADVRMAINAGVDIVMAAEQHWTFLPILRAEVEAGRIPMARIDDANRRILRRKLALGLFEHPYADRSRIGDIGSPAHRAVAREAVQKSMVVLKNDGVLPLSRTASKVFVAGKNADDIGHQSGGWTVTWQGGSGPITPGTTILGGIRQRVSSGTTVTYDREGRGVDGSYDVAIAVVGEAPYAEYEGDRTDDLTLDAEDVATLARLRAAGIPVVVVLVSGRPLDITDHIDGWSAFVAAWLPGTEGGGVADVLFGAVSPSGKLPLTWMRRASQQPINDGDGQSALFPLGAGLTYPAVPDEPGEPETPPGLNARDTLRAERFTGQQGVQTEPCSEPGCGLNVGWIAPGDHFYFDDVDFGATAPTTLSARVASGGGAGTAELRLDAVNGPIIASLAMTPTGGWTSWVTRTATVSSNATGRHRLYWVFTGPGGDFMNVSWFRFE